MTCANIAIAVKGISKAYVIAHQAPRHTTLAEAVVDRLRHPFRRFASETFWALRDVSFELSRGSVLGVIGRNGAGKSTLLKILARITQPTSGRAELCGRVGSLLEVGTGFHPELTGRENIYLNGQILGMRKREIDAEFDAIVEFAGVETFLDTPVKRYSSGMHVRLAFAVAAHLRSEILLVDEVLAVGDAEFQKRCVGRMGEVARSGRTVLFVSHNLSAVTSLCTDSIVLHQGRLVFQGAPADAVERYKSDVASRQGSAWVRNGDARAGALVVRSARVELTGEQPNHQLSIDLSLESRSPHKPAYLAVDLLDSAGVAIMQAVPTLDRFIRDDRAGHELQIQIDLPPLIPGDYSLSIWLGSHNTETLDWVKEVVGFTIDHSPTHGRTFPHSIDRGYIVPPSRIVSSDAVVRAGEANAGVE
ncbi:MAG TPA: polysaccharide ABC transporter ATP-binding protein [Tepidisphaeraceae bacterium]|nr:polysaccharide ABC transporter ATP-binding protein [Tepidisphaeraceae bacterium]